MRVFVGNLSFRATEHDVREAFEICGTVTQIIMPESQTHPGQNRGYAIVVFSSDEEGWRACGQMGGAMIAGRPIRVTEAEAPRWRN